MTEVTSAAQRQPRARALASLSEARRRFVRRHTRTVKVGAIVAAAALLLLILGAALAPVIAPYPYAEQNYDEISNGISAAHWLGTDDYGRDVLSRLLYGSGVSLVTASGSVAIASFVGVSLGLLAAMGPKWFSVILMRLTDTILAFPTVLLALSLTAAFGRGTGGVIIAISVAICPPFIRMMRVQVLAVRERLYVKSSQTFGASVSWMTLRHILPNAIAPVIVLITQYLAVSMLIEAGLSFLGLGTPPPYPSWGQMLRDAAREMAGPTVQVLAPGLAIFITVLSINVIGDWVRDVLDPRSN